MTQRECKSCFKNKPLTEFRLRNRPLKSGKPCYLRTCKKCYNQNKALTYLEEHPTRGKAIPVGNISEKFLVRGRIYYEGYNYGT